MSKETKIEKLAGEQLVETIKDVIYEVLEEELQAKLELLEKSKKDAETIKNFQEQKKQLDESYKRIAKTLAELKK